MSGRMEVIELMREEERRFRSEERERCAKMLDVEAIRLEEWPRHVLWPEGATYLRSLAAAIRAGGTK